MKTFHYIALALTALLLVTSCAIDEMWSDVEPADEQKVLTFKPKFEDFETVTKAIGDGSKVDKLLVQVYEENGENGETLVFSDEYYRDDWNKVQIAFYYGKTYKVYFWAYDSNAPFTAYKYTIINGEIQLNKPIEINYHQNDLAYNTLESLDAFFSVQTVNLSASDKKENTVKLTRPFAQVNLGALAEDFDDAQVSEAVFKVNGIPSVFTLSDSGVNAVENPETITSPSFTFTDFDLDDDESQITFDNTDYRYIGTTYILVPSLTDKVTVDVAIFGQDPNSPMKEATVELTVGSNKRTNLIFKEIAPSWNDSLADSSEDVPSTETEGGWIHITKPEELAALLIYGGTEGKKYHICANLDMSGMPQATASKIGLAESGYRKLTIDAGKYNGDKVTGSYMLKNINGLKAFFGIASDLHIQNIILDNVNVSGDTHVGVLVNSLSGEKNTFTNVTIQNSSAQTSSGAAGGMIGYVVRSSKEDRSETLSVTVDNCKINSTTVAGNQAEGKFVGLFSGYDNGETLVFTGCSADDNTKVADYDSRYVEGNEGAWLAEKDYKEYNGWLGDEEYYRGKIYFGDPTEEANRFCPKWDGETTKEPIYEDTSKKIAQIWSAFDLAYLQGKSMTTLRFKSNVDMCGICNECKVARSNPCSEALYLNTSGHKCASCPDELYHCDKCTYFTPIQTINNIYGEEHTIFNLNIQQEHNNGMSWGAGFCNRLNSGTIENLTFDGAYIKCTDIQSLRNNTQSGGNAYAGTLASRTSESASITIKNVHANNGYVTAVSKLGGMIGYVHGTLNASDCSVNNYTIENNKINVINTYSKSVSISSLGTFAVSAEFYTEGESGGFIGFLTSGNSVISDCHVNNAIMKCYGQENQTKYITGKFLGFIPVSYPYNIAGRHINAFIGDIRTVNQETITITNCSATYTSPEGYDYNINSKGKGEIIGCCYIVGVANVVGDKKGKVTVDGESMNFVGD